MTEEHDDRIRELAHELRREDAETTPPFEALWTAAQEGATSRPLWETWWRPLTALAAAAAVIVVAVSTGVFTSDAIDGPGGDPESVTLTAWRAPSVDLLEIDGIGLLDLSEPAGRTDDGDPGLRNLRLPTDGLLGNFDTTRPSEREL